MLLDGSNFDTCDMRKKREVLRDRQGGTARKQRYRSDGRFWPVVLCRAVVRRKSESLRLVSMRSDNILHQQQLRR
jgi:hypothetical protein